MKKRTDKQMVIASASVLLAMTPSIGIAAISLPVYEEWYVRLSLLALMATAMLYVWIYGRCLVDKAYRRRRLIERNDERYQQLVYRAAYLTFLVLMGLISMIFGFALAYDFDGGLLMVPLRLIIIPLWAAMMVTFVVSLLVLEKIG